MGAVTFYKQQYANQNARFLLTIPDGSTAIVIVYHARPSTNREPFICFVNHSTYRYFVYHLTQGAYGSVTANEDNSGVIITSGGSWGYIRLVFLDGTKDYTFTQL